MKARQGVVLLVVSLLVIRSQADDFGTGTNQFTMDFVNIGHAGNAADTTGYGAVADSYRIGKFEVTAAQWASVIAADSDVGDAGSWSGIQAVGASSWYEAAKFANWLTSGSYSNGAYQFSDPNTLVAVDRASAVSTYGTVYVLPTEDEWYKAAYLKSDATSYTLYATGSSTPIAGTNANYGAEAPWAIGSGTAENNGTFDMGGNVWEWSESAADGTLDVMTESRVRRGGSFASATDGALRSTLRKASSPTSNNSDYGFRVVAIAQVEVSIFNVAESNAVEIGWTSIPGVTHQVQYSTNLVSTNWFDLGTNVVGDGLTNYVFDSVLGLDKRFYRVIQ